MSERKAYLRRARQWIANRGFRSFLQVASQRLWYKLLRKPIPGRVRPDTGPHPFDLKHNVDTTGLIFGEALFDHRGRTDESVGVHYWVTGYYGVAPSAFVIAMNQINLDWPQYTFVDIGCGKGRALLLALQYPFREVVGVELATELAAVAEANLGSFQADWRQPYVPTRVIAGDATTFPLPSGPLMLFLYHPFAGPVMKQFLAHLKRSVADEPREVILLYGNPELAPEIEATPGFELLWREAFGFTPEDVAADRFGSTYEQFAVYRLTASKV